MARNVRGLLFVDYVRVLRKHERAAASPVLQAEDFPFLDQQISPSGWYPMETFERFGLVILDQVIGHDFDTARRVGQQQIRGVVQGLPMLLAPNDPRDTLMRFRVMTRELFDFPAIDLTAVSDEHASVVVDYDMSPDAEHAAAMQTMGFFEALLELAGAREIQAVFESRRWDGAARTVLSLQWLPPA